ncbi:Glu-tRNA(Gln) amidotransferase GatDE subunit D, partial [Candidatus Pacearchaeota archaeon]
MKTKRFHVADRVVLETRKKVWRGTILDSYDPEVVLLKLDSGYNIGIPESEIINAELVEPAKPSRGKKLTIQKKKGLKNVALVISGGTISSRVDTRTGAVKPSEASDIISMCPEVSNICNIVKVVRPFMKLSGDISYREWKVLSEVIFKLLKEVDGVILTHGTDTLTYTASALSFFLRNLSKPIAVTYSQKSIDRPSTDASLNLLCAAKYATSDIAEVALIGHESMNDDYCLAMPATRTRKMHTSRRDAFKVINDLPIARISKEEFKILREFRARSQCETVLDNRFSEKVALIKVHPGSDPDILKFFERKKIRGVVLETTGLGQVPTEEARLNWLPKIRSAISCGMTICAVAQTLYG